ncbi:MAG TPA: tetratricopeptide repeat protein [Candidatus Polarisedimenticolia bacterium]|nr:tetratricopeptide repeat protein [Candidatus Polarisedimenticolia bacterium]
MTARRILGFLVLAVTAAFCLTPLAEVDFFWHLLAGRRMIETGHVPRVDEFTFTSAGSAWIDTTWLFQVAAASAHAAGGWALLDVLKVAIVTTAFALALCAAARRQPTLAAPLLALPAVVAAQERFTLRPEIVSFLLLAVLLVLLGERRRHPALLWLVPVLFALWANVHSLVAAGFAAFLLVIAGDVIDQRLGRAPEPDARAAPKRALAPGAPGFLAMLAGLATLATLVTPYGFEAWRLARTLLFERISGETMFAHRIAEFQSPFSGYGETTSVAALALLLTLIAGAVFLGRRALASADALLLAAFVALALLARRNMPLLGIVTIPCAAPAASAAWRDLERRLAGAAARVPFERGARLVVTVGAALAALGLLGGIVSNRLYARDGTQRAFGIGLAPGVFPETAAGLVARLRPAGQAFHDLADGGYLAWRWWPERRTYIDGRLEVHSGRLFTTWLQAQEDPARFEAEARARDIGLVLWSHRDAPDAAPLLRHLAASPDWTLAHVDLEAALFLRRDPEGRASAAADSDREDPAPRLLLEAQAAEHRAVSQDPLPGWFRRLVPRQPIPAGETGAGLFFALTGRPEVAVRLFEDAARRAPWSAALQYDLGLARSAAGHDAEARADFEAALRLDPDLVGARAAIAQLRLRAGDEAGALAEWEKAERAGPLPAEALASRAALHAERRRFDAAIEDYRQALRLSPARADWRADLSLILLARGLVDPARAEAERAVALAPGSCRARLAEARVRRAAGDVPGAIETLRAALASEPGCVEGRLEAARLLAAAGRIGEARREIDAALAAGAVPGVLAADPVLAPLLQGR